MSRPDTYENTFRLFDQAIYNWLGGLLVDYGDIVPKPEAVDPTIGVRTPVRDILRVMSTPERAFAEMQNLLVAKGWMEESERSDDFTNIPLPFASIYRMGPIPRLSQMQVPMRLKRLFRDSEGNWLGADFPTPWDISYDIHFWVMKRYTEVHIWDWIVGRVGRRGASPADFYLEVDHEKYPHDHHALKTCIYGKQLHSVHFDALTDLTDIEPEEMAPRYIRFSLMLTVRAWMMHPLTVSENGKIAVMIEQGYEDDSVSERTSLSTGSTRVGVSRSCSSFDLPNTIELCTVSTSDNLLNAIPYLNKFDYSDGVIVEADDCSYDIRAEVYRLRFEYPVDGGWVQTWRLFPLPLLRFPNSAPCLVGCRFDYKLPAGAPAIDFEILGVEWVVVPDPANPLNPAAVSMDPEYSVIQRHRLTPVAGRWCRLEVFCQQPKDIAFRFVSAGAVVLDLDNVEFIIRHPALGATEYVTDSDCEAPTTAAWTPILGAALSKVDLGGNTVLRVQALAIGEGVEQIITVEPHIIFSMLRLQVLNVTGQWRIMLDNDAVTPTFAESIDIDGDWTNVALAASPVATGTTHRLRIEALTANAIIDLDDVSLRKYSGPVWSTAVPIN